MFIVTPGQSGHVASPHYADLVDDFLNLRYRPLLWDAADIEANAEGDDVYAQRRADCPSEDARWSRAGGRPLSS
ncbi:MAG: penicillin acylase family protein [bacterium]